jgi:poly(A) polymerase
VLLGALRAVLRERGGAGWLVGGTVRDRQMGRTGTDVDVVVDGDPRAFAAAVAARAGLPWFALSREWGAYRVVGSPGHLDVAAMRGGGLAADLALRDFTVNAMALPVTGGVLVDPFGGQGHLEQGRLVAVGGRIFADDPLRLLRAVRLAHTLDLRLDPALRDLARAEAHRLRETAAERVLSEVVSTLAAGRSAAAVGLWANLGLLGVFLPEVTALHGVVQSTFHHLDAYRHTLDAMERLDELIAAPGVHFGRSEELLAARLARPVDGVMPRPVALRLGTLLHDVAKPQTRALDDQGRVMFWGHTELGGPIAEGVCARLRCSTSATSLVRRVVERHLDLGFLQHENPLTPRSEVRYLWDAAPWEPEVILVSVADRLATRGPSTEPRHVARHLAAAGALMERWRVRTQDGVPRPPITGRDLMAELGLAPGRLLGEVLRDVALAWESGEIADRSEALATARSSLGRLRAAATSAEDAG